MSEAELRDAALDYHQFPGPGKISVLPTEALANQRDLSLAYSPGVAYVARPIHIMTRCSTVRRIVNMTAVAVAEVGAQ
jgi:malic enzyme